MVSNADILLIAAGNESAFRRFFDAYHNKVYGYIKTIVKTNEVAEEIMLDVFLKVWIKRAALPQVQNMDGFLFIICKRKALDFLKAAAKDKVLQQKIAVEIAAVQTIDANNVTAAWENKDWLANTLKELSPQRKIIFTLSHIEGYSYDEIAQALSISRNTVKNTITQGLKSLRKASRQVESCLTLFFIGQSFYFFNGSFYKSYYLAYVL